jgi:protein TonB
MKKSKKKLGGAGQSTTQVKKTHKHEANLQKNSSLYFQIGLILCLLATYGLFEMQFEKDKIILETNESADVAVIDIAPIYQVEKRSQKNKKQKIDRATKLVDKFIEVKNAKALIETTILSSDKTETIAAPIDPSSLPDEENPDETDIFVPIISLEVVPVFPGCEKYDTNDKRKKCLSKEIGKWVSKKFNTNIGSEYGITGKQNIQTQFTIDKHGNVTDVKIRAPHPALKEEALRVIGKIPKMKPGYQQDKPVGVIYSLPITFYVTN